MVTTQYLIYISCRNLCEQYMFTVIMYMYIMYIMYIYNYIYIYTSSHVPRLSPLIT